AKDVEPLCRDHVASPRRAAMPGYDRQKERHGLHKVLRSYCADRARALRIAAKRDMPPEIFIVARSPETHVGGQPVEMHRSGIAVDGDRDLGWKRQGDPPRRQRTTQRSRKHLGIDFLLGGESRQRVADDRNSLTAREPELTERGREFSRRFVRQPAYLN